MTKPNDAKDKAQISAFRKAARELGCDESEELFQEGVAVDRQASAEPQAQNTPEAGLIRPLLNDPHFERIIGGCGDVARVSGATPARPIAELSTCNWDGALQRQKNKRYRNHGQDRLCVISTMGLPPQLSEPSNASVF
jgi:hypothetical protein